MKCKIIFIVRNDNLEGTVKEHLESEIIKDSEIYDFIDSKIELSDGELSFKFLFLINIKTKEILLKFGNKGDE